MSGHYSPLKSSQEFVASRHKLPAIPTPKPTSLGANSSWMTKQNYPAGNAKPVTNSSTLWCTSSLQKINQVDKTEIRISNNLHPAKEQLETMDLLARSHAALSSKLNVESSKPSVNGNVLTVLPVNGSAKLKDSVSANITDFHVVAPNAKKSTNPLVKPSNITEIVPSDEVESALESMFESDSKSITPISSILSQSRKSTADLIGESVEKILKSPSPMKVEETSLEADKFVSNNVAAVSETECDTNHAGVVTNSNDTPNKIRDKSFSHSSEKLETTKSQLELALTVKNEKCDKFNDVNNSVSTSKVRTPNDVAKKSASNDETYVEVESELAKMFAGIEDVETNDTNTTALDTTTVKTYKPISNPLPIKSNDSSLNSCSSTPLISNPGPSNLTGTVPRKPKKTYKKRSTSKSKIIISSNKSSKTKQSGKENSLESVTTKRVPVIHIEGSKENPISVQIINSIKTEEDDVSDSKTAAKRKFGKTDRPVKKLATDYVLKNYDPSSSDSSWVCIFCKLSAHNINEMGESSGDLFGPYFIRDPDRGESERERQPASDHLRTKQKRSESRGGESVDTSVSEEKSKEIWAHEDCFIWAPGVHLIGSKLIGLEEAVWDSLKTKCIRCGQNGANIGCKARQCRSFMHYGCAIFSGWKLDVEKFISVCNLHAVPD